MSGIPIYEVKLVRHIREGGQSDERIRLPSGDLTPSPDDRAITQRLVHAGKLLDIDVCDHIIVGEGARFCSFLEAGLLVTAPSDYN